MTTVDGSCDRHVTTLSCSLQCFLTYISPFDWRHPCVPILPYQLLEYLEAPGTNIMGCHSSINDSPELQQVCLSLYLSAFVSRLSVS